MQFCPRSFKPKPMSNRNKLAWAVLVAEMGHIVCCGIPGVLSLLSLLVGIGFISTVPPELEGLHEAIHHYEGYFIIGSLFILVLGWAFYLFARKMDCSTSPTCAHAPCKPKKDFSKVILIGASVLFLLNASFYVFIHT